MKEITLKTLPESTEQEVFDFVATHLLAQKKQSVSHGFEKDVLCVYRNLDGLKCAAGCLFGKDEYQPKFESYLWSTLAKYGDVPTDHMSLITSLQNVHDDADYDSPLNDFIAGLKAVAKTYKLNAAVVEKLETWD